MIRDFTSADWDRVEFILYLLIPEFPVSGAEYLANLGTQTTSNRFYSLSTSFCQLALPLSEVIGGMQFLGVK